MAKAQKKTAKKATKKATKKAVKKAAPKKKILKATRPKALGGRASRDREILGYDCYGDPITLTKAERTIKRKGRSAIVLPDDMPDKVCLQVKQGKMCGAKCSKEAKKIYCECRKTTANKERQPPYRCKFHGGANTGAPDDNKHALKTGIYADCLLPGEEEEFEALMNNDLRYEISITKLRLRRAIRAEKRVETMEDDGEDLERELVLVEHSEDKGYGPEGPTEHTKKVRKLPDYSRMINVLVNQLCKLQNQQLLKETGGDKEITPEQRAAIMRQALAEAEDL